MSNAEIWENGYTRKKKKKKITKTLVLYLNLVTVTNMVKEGDLNSSPELTNY